MQESGARREHPGLTELVVEASRALARLDANRLEELALSCQALTKDLSRANAVERASLASQARASVGDMAVFARVLEATRANLKVMNRLRELRAGRLEYGEPPAAAGLGWTQTGSGHGDN
jgi:hypothetical protein